MARGPIPYIVQKTNGDAVSGATISVNIRGGGPASVFANETGATPATSPLLTDVDGKVSVWLDEGSYDVTASGAGITTTTRPLEVVRGRSVVGTGNLVLDSKLAAFYVGHTWTVGGALSAGMGIPSFFVPVAAGQVVAVVGVRAKIASGTSIAIQLTKNGSNVSSAVTVNATPTTTSLSTTIANGDELGITTASPTGVPADLSFTVVLSSTPA